MRPPMGGAEQANDSEIFYDRLWQHTETAADPAIVAKGDLLLGMMPPGVRTVADVGCGDGYLTHRLAERYDVLAIDRSPVALARLRVRTLQASADALPLPDGAMDLVFSSQMLEHLPDQVLAGAAREFDRIAARYLLVSVPFRENLRRRFARCPRCGLEFNIYGHLQSFDAASLDRLFPRFERIATELAGPPELATSRRIERLRQRALGCWFLPQGVRVSCPGCGEADLAAPRVRLSQRVGRLVLDGATEAWRLASGERAQPYWIVALYRRRGEAA
ncbi:class I SAM-dependent methyltransferase [Sorangium sp. So ce315]|uniref:class I SAM-dependent methyltransferase n=1 Tax=Sorangium sp. So ce315 TaxID=3133299 RepID=UPI003F5E007F